MATNYKNILLKDNQGNALLPITLSYYVEYKNGIDVRSYLDTLSGDLNNVNSYIDDINSTLTNQDTRFNTLTDSINEAFAYFSSYVQKPDYASYIVFDNSSYFSDLENDYNGGPDGISYVSVQKVIEAIDTKIDNNRTELNSSISTINGNVDGLTTRVTTAESDIDSLESRVGTLESDLTDAKSDLEYAYAKVNDLFPEGNLSIDASAVSFEPSNTTTMFNNVTNVDGALDALETKVNALDGTIAAAVSGAVNSVASSSPDTILVQGVGDGPEKNGAVSVGLILNSDGKLKSSASGLTIDESKLDLTNVTTYANNISGMIQPSQIEGGLDADNIIVTYSYTDNTGDTPVEHTDGQKTVQEFYNEYDNKIKELEAASSATALDGKYKVTVTPSDSTNFAKVYTLTQNSETIGTINIPKDQFLDSVYYINSQSDVATKLPSGMTLTNEELAELPALVFIWKVDNAKSYSVVSIKSILGTVTNEIDTKVSALEDRVDTLETKVEALETASATHITGVTLDGTAGTVSNGVVSLTSSLKYDSGTSTDGVSEGFLQMHGITSETTNP